MRAVRAAASNLQIRRISVASDGTQANGFSLTLRITADGRYVEEPHLTSTSVHCGRVKLTVAVITTGAGRPLTSVGENRHCRAVSIAA